MHRTVHGGGGRIRTFETRKGLTLFESAPIDHSGTPPHEHLTLCYLAGKIKFFCTRRTLNPWDFLVQGQSSGLVSSLEAQNRN